MKRIWAIVITAFSWTAASGQGFMLEEGIPFITSFGPAANINGVLHYQTPGIQISLSFDPLTIQWNERVRVELFYQTEEAPFWSCDANLPSAGLLTCLSPPEVVVHQSWIGAERMRLTMLDGEATLTGASQYAIYTNGDWLHNDWFSVSFNRDVVIVPEPQVHYLLLILGCLYALGKSYRRLIA